MSGFDIRHQRMIADLLDPRATVAFRPALARSLGATTALFLSQAIYWQNKKGIDEWFYKNRDAYRLNGVMIEPGTTIKRKSDDGEVKIFLVPQSWEWELGLTRSEQETARRKLVKLGLLEERDQGIPCKKYFRVNFNKIIEFLLKNQQLAESCQLDGEIQLTGRIESYQLAGRIPTSITKTTTKTTTEAVAPHAQACGTTPSTAAAVGLEKRRHPQRTKNGIECWDQADDVKAHEIETSFKADDIKIAIKAVKSMKNSANKPKSPFPCAVEDELIRRQRAAANTQVPNLPRFDPQSRDKLHAAVKNSGVKLSTSRK